MNLHDAKYANRKPRKSDGTIYVCQCECGGRVRGVWQFGRLFSYCEKCTQMHADNHDNDSQAR